MGDAAVGLRMLVTILGEARVLEGGEEGRGGWEKWGGGGKRGKVDV
jgi:hypothetical protein